MPRLHSSPQPHSSDVWHTPTPNQSHLLTKRRQVAGSLSSSARTALLLCCGLCFVALSTFVLIFHALSNSAAANTVEGPGGLRPRPPGVEASGGLLSKVDKPKFSVESQGKIEVASITSVVSKAEVEQIVRKGADGMSGVVGKAESAEGKSCLVPAAGSVVGSQHSWFEDTDLKGGDLPRAALEE
jgi:hypothetical protein